MVFITGTSGNETLIGTNAADTITANGGKDLLLGKGGADTYQLFFNRVPSAQMPEYKINESNSGDTSIDTITGTGSLVQYSIGGILDYAEFKRTGPDGQHLVMETAYKANYWNNPGVEAGKITIINQYAAATPLAQIEKIIAGGIEYNLLTTNTGTAFSDIMTGWKLSDTFNAGEGADYVSGGSGRDYLHGEGGNDIIFGDQGSDFVYGGLGTDTVFGGYGNDKIFGGEDNDLIKGGVGKDMLRGENGDDTLEGGDQNDRLFGGEGKDRLIGGSGNDTMTGNKGGDTYVVSSLGSGSDTIIDKGSAALVQYGWLTSNLDEIEFTDFGSFDTAFHSISFQLSGDDLLISYENPAMPGVSGQVTIQSHFLGGRYALEQIDFGTGGIDAVYHIAHLKGDDYTYSVHGGSDVGGNDIVLGTVDDDEIYGGLGSDIILGGGGADHFMFHDEEDGRGGTDIILDFDLTNDILDFTDISGFDFSGLTIVENAYGNVVISSIYGAIELDGISAIEVSANIFAFA
ncbi:MAG: calcium-binding protein [Rhodobacteraceae bacterium]|nr:calcium-binding protein [Paracoccaceae bacterium]